VPLPAITTQMTIDGTTSPGYDAVSGTPGVSIQASGGLFTAGLVVNGGGGADYTVIKAIHIWDDVYSGVGIDIGANYVNVIGCYYTLIFQALSRTVLCR